jgi:arsenite methyltransferase
MSDSVVPTPITSGNSEELRAIVRERYGAAAQAVRRGAKAACCDSSCCGSTDGTDPITADHYVNGEASQVPAQALAASLGCGNPTALAELKPGEIVLDLGSGGGIDVLLSARRVGPTGKAYGLDMTDQMLALARENQQRAGVTNVEFLKGEIEHIPLPDASVDVIISNCVINLAADKDVVLREAFRVLKPGGRFAVSDIIVRREVPDDIRRNLELWTGCVAGALAIDEYREKLTDAGFDRVDIEPTRIYTAEDAAAFLSASGLNDTVLSADIDGAFMSGFVRATKPAMWGCRGAAQVPPPPVPNEAMRPKPENPGPARSHASPEARGPKPVQARNPEARKPEARSRKQEADHEGTLPLHCQLRPQPDGRRVRPAPGRPARDGSERRIAADARQPARD